MPGAMASYGKPDPTGRSSGTLNRAERKLLGPPQDEAWTWITLDLLESAAWRGASIHCLRFIFCLLAEHCGHAGRENGHLVATYVQLEQAGVRRQRIAAAIREAVRRGLVVVELRGGLYGVDNCRTASRYRLTWIGCIDGRRTPTNEWRKFDRRLTRGKGKDEEGIQSVRGNESAAGANPAARKGRARP